MNRNTKILFWGGLPPATINGVTISNLINLNILSKEFQIDCIEECNSFRHHGKLSLFKIKSFVKSNLAIIKRAYKNHYKYFYLVFSVSTLGGIKTLLAIVCFRMFNQGKVVLHIHRGDFFSAFYKSRINKIIASLVLILTNKIIVLSESQKKEIQLKFNNCVEVLTNTVEIEYKYDPIVKQNINFLYISNYLVDKGILDLLEVFKKLIKKYPYINLQTFGAFSDQQLKKIILGYNSTNIQIHNTISGIEKFQIISQSDCLILPSWNEGQPIVLLEAMSVGTPVISTNVGLIPELLGSDYPFLSLARDQVSLENTIIKFIESKTNPLISKELIEKYNNFYSHKKHKETLFQIFP